MIKHCTEYYFNQQNDRNKIMNDPELQKESLTKQANRLTKEVQQRGVIAKRFISTHSFKKEKAAAQYIKDWIWTVSKIFNREDKNDSRLDIRNYFMKKQEERYRMKL